MAIYDGKCTTCRNTGHRYGYHTVRTGPGENRVIYAWVPCECPAGQDLEAKGVTDPEFAAHLCENRTILENAEDLMPF